MMGRWVAGLGIGALSLLVPMYQGLSLGGFQDHYDADHHQLRQLLVTFAVR